MRTDKKYLDYIRQMPCKICGYPAEPHHIRSTGDGLGQKPDDRRTIPLCRLHHAEAHAWGDKTFQERHDINYEEIMNKLGRYYEEA